MFYQFQILSCTYATKASKRDKIYCSVDDAVKDIPNSAKLLVGGVDKL